MRPMAATVSCIIQPGVPTQVRQGSVCTIAIVMARLHPIWRQTNKRRKHQTVQRAFLSPAARTTFRQIDVQVSVGWIYERR